jgi:hypothetical protein
MTLYKLRSVYNREKRKLRVTGRENGSSNRLMKMKKLSISQIPNGATSHESGHRSGRY